MPRSRPSRREPRTTTWPGSPPRSAGSSSPSCASTRPSSYLEPAAARLGPALESPGRVALEGQLGRAYGLSGRQEDAEIVLRRTIEAAERIGPEDALIEAIISYGSMTIYHGRLSGLAMLFGSVELARRAGLVRSELRALNNLSAWAGDADPPLARELTVRMLELSDRTGYGGMSTESGMALILAWTDSLEAAEHKARELSERIEPGGRDEIDLMLTWLTLAQLSGDWELWDSARATLEAAADANPEATDWREFTTALGLLVRGRVDEAADLIRASSGPHVVPLGALTGLLRRDSAEVEAAVEGSRERWAFQGPYKSGLRRLGRAGLGLLEAVTEPDLDACLLGVDELRGSELADAWTMGVVAFIELAGPDRPQVRNAVDEVRARPRTRRRAGLPGSPRAGADEVSAEAGPGSAAVAAGESPGTRSTPSTLVADAAAAREP